MRTATQHRRERFNKTISSLTVCFMIFGWHSNLYANGTGGTVTSGSATIAGMGTSQVVIQQASQRAIINWLTFNIAPGESTIFNQPAGGWTLNRIGDSNASFINGLLQANGSIILLNRNGVLFGPNAQVNVGGLIASSLNLTDANFLSGHYLFQGSGVEGPVRNEGAITAGVNGVYLLAPNVQNAATGVIRSPDGYVSLAAGTTAFLSNRPDGRGFLTEVTAPANEALNLGQLVADGGLVTMAGRVVNQNRLVQANTVRKRNGRIELIASEQVNLGAGSRTVAQGGEAGASGGTVVGRAAAYDNATGVRTDGTVTVSSGAQIDVSPQGGLPGEVWLGGTVAQNGTITGTSYKQIPNTVNLTDTDLAQLASQSSRGEINVLAMDDVKVSTTSQFDLLGVSLPFGQQASFFLQAGRDVLFNNSTFGPLFAKWNIVGRAGRDLVLNGTYVTTQLGGNIHFHAGRDLKLVNPPNSGVVSLINTSFSGGDVSLTALNDVVIPSPINNPNSNLQGVRVGSPGNLTVRAGRDFVGSTTTMTNPPGPGFTLSDGTADVSAGRDIGTEQAPANLNLGIQLFKHDGTTYSPETHVTMNAGRSLYFGRAQDYGLREDSVLTANQNNSLSLTAWSGDIMLLPGTQQSLLRNYPATFSARAEQGSIIVRAGEQPLAFWPSPTGRITFYAKNEIRGEGVPQIVPDVNSVLFFAGVPGDPAAKWVRMDRNAALADPNLAKWYVLYGDASPDGLGGGKVPVGAPPLSSLPRSMLERPNATIKGNSSVMKLYPGDLTDLYGQFIDQTSLALALRTPASTVTTEAMPVSFKTDTGNISGLLLDFYSPSFQKQFSISSGKDLVGFAANFSVPETSGGQPIVGALVSAAGSIDMRKTGGFSGLNFYGKGTAQVRANGDLNLADSIGINYSLRPSIATLTNQGGRLDIGVGGNLDMTQSRIYTFNGAGISIHGADGGPILVNGSPVPGAIEAMGSVIRDSQGRDILAISTTGGQSTPIQPFNKSAVVDPQAVFSVKDVENGKVELVWKPLYVNQGGQTYVYVVAKDRSSVTNGATWADTKPLKVVQVDLNPQKAADGTTLLADGRPALIDGHLVLIVNGQQVSFVSPVGGRVNVGGNSRNVAEQTGIVTQRGGSIAISAIGNVEVNLSRIGTLNSGDITIQSAAGNINAGSGGKDEKTTFVINDGSTNVAATVPGSGIFTWHRDDPDFASLPFPKFNTPAMDALFATITKERFLGRDTTKFEQQFDALAKARTVEYDQIFEQFITAPRGPKNLPLQLGDITLIAANNIVVPPAGIRGKRITLDAGNSLDLQGGSIIGKTKLNVPQITGSIAGAFGGSATGAVGGAGFSAAGGAGGSSVGGLSGATATVSATASSTGSSSSTASKAVEQVQQSTTDAANTQSQSSGKQVASKSDDKDSKGQLAKSVRVKRGVVIQVDAKAQAQ